jgi:hypothetical protein
MTDQQGAPIPALGTPGEHHFQIAARAEIFLKAAATGNGLDPGQVRLVKHDTSVWPLHGAVIAILKPHVIKSHRKGRQPQGDQVGSQQLALARIDGMIPEIAGNPDIQEQVAAVVAKDAGAGWDIEAQKVPLRAPPRQICTIDKCPKCVGQGGFNCVPCHGSGRAPCQPCTGSGKTNCTACSGSGQYMRPDGRGVQCVRCHGSGKTNCTTCNGQKTRHCQPCNGTGRAPCGDCGATGWWTTVYSPNWEAEFTFAFNEQDANPGAMTYARQIGFRAVATDGHAEMLHDHPYPEGPAISVPVTALFPLAEAEFAAGGKSMSATVAGLRGRVMRIEPFLDPYIRPALDALVKVSQGGIATGALLATACKTRLVNEVLSSLPKLGKKRTYARVLEDYNPAVSDKYARAAVARGAEALSSLGKGPRMQGFVIGTILAGGMAAGWYLSSVRTQALMFIMARNGARLMPAVDVAVWLAGWGVAVLLIRGLATRAVARLLPAGEKPPVQAMDREGWYALASTFVLWLGFAVTAAARPEWLALILKKFGL